MQRFGSLLPACLLSFLRSRKNFMSPSHGPSSLRVPEHTSIFNIVFLSLPCLQVSPLGLVSTWISLKAMVQAQG